MKVAFLNLYSGINNRGAETFARELAKNLSAYHGVTFYTGKALDLGAVRVLPVKSWSSSPQQGFGFGFVNDLRKRFFLDAGSLASLAFTLKIFRQLFWEKYDLLVPMNGFWQVIICKIISLFRGSKILITGHSGPGWDERWNLYLKPNIFVASTQPTAIWAKKTCRWTKVVTIPYGVDITKYSQAKPVKLTLKRPIILCPAAAVRYKQVESAIKAVAKLKNGSLLHLGSGPLKDEIKIIGNKLLGGNRFLSKAVSIDEMPGYYAACDLVTLPSTTQENSPMVFLEAMAAGKVIVTTDAPRSHWILGDAGIFINPGNSNEYAIALELALNLKGAKEKARKRAELFSWDEIIKEYEKVITSL